VNAVAPREHDTQALGIRRELLDLAGLVPSARQRLLWVYTPDIEKALRQMRLALTVAQGIEER
jgi:hypothetical protein